MTPFLSPPTPAATSTVMSISTNTKANHSNYDKSVLKFRNDVLEHFESKLDKFTNNFLIKKSTNREYYWRIHGTMTVQQEIIGTTFTQNFIILAFADFRLLMSFDF